VAANQVLQTLPDECGVIVLSLAWLSGEIVEELVPILDDLTLYLLSLRRSVARLPIADVEVDLDLVEDGSAQTLVVLVGFLWVRFETTDRIVAGCIQSFLVHLCLRDLTGSLRRISIPGGGVLTEDSLREGLLLLVVHLLRATWVSCGRGVVAIEMAEQLLARVAVARVNGHVRLVLDVRKFGPAGELSDGPIQRLARRDVGLWHCEAIPGIVVWRLRLQGPRLRPATGHARPAQVIRYFGLTWHALDLRLLEDLLALAA
jgi:hypothetical protein